ncbi:MAG: HsmA family protein [Candidatus Thorarchaeota archaeon]
MQMAMTFGLTFMLVALTAYSIAVWGEQITKDLKPIFVVLFCVGVACDSTGTLMMVFDLDAGMATMGLYDYIFHMVTGVSAILLMLIHAIWAIKVLFNKDEVSAAKFHKFSKFVWVFWLVPFLSPMFAGMMA